MFNEIKCTSVVVSHNFCIGEDLNFLQKVNKNPFKRVMIKILLSVNCGSFNCSSTIYIVQPTICKYKPIGRKCDMPLINCRLDNLTKITIDRNKVIFAFLVYIYFILLYVSNHIPSHPIPKQSQ